MTLPAASSGTATDAPRPGLLACIASHTSNPAVMKQVPYDFARDFAPISLTVTLPNVLVSHPSLPARNVKELIALARDTAVPTQSLDRRALDRLSDGANHQGVVAEVLEARGVTYAVVRKLVSGGPRSR